MVNQVLHRRSSVIRSVPTSSSILRTVAYVPMRVSPIRVVVGEVPRRDQERTGAGVADGSDSMAVEFDELGVRAPPGAVDAPEKPHPLVGRQRHRALFALRTARDGADTDRPDDGLVRHAYDS